MAVRFVENGEGLVHGHSILVSQQEDARERGGSDRCTTLETHTVPPNCTITNGCHGKFMLFVFYHSENNWGENTKFSV